MRASARFIVGALVLCGTACDHPSVPTPAAPAPISPTVASVTIDGVPASLTVGQTVQLTASVTLSDGTRSDATTQAAWQSSDVTVAIVSSAGLLAIAAPGDADVTATLQTVQGRAHVSVPKPSPPRTGFDISGLVHESAPTEDVALSGATVGIHFVGCPSCPHDNETTTTGADGRFTLPGIDRPGFALVVSKSGYETTQFGVVELPRDGHPDIAMLPPPGQISFDIAGADVCTEHPSDPFFSKLSNPAHPDARILAVIDAHRNGIVSGGPTSPWPFSDGAGILVYSISANRQPVIAPTSSAGYVVTAGTRYYYLGMGEVELCRHPYRIPFTRPR
jgi:hypothetical protein